MKADYSRNMLARKKKKSSFEIPWPKAIEWKWQIQVYSKGVEFHEREQNHSALPLEKRQRVKILFLKLLFKSCLTHDDNCTVLNAFL